MLFRVLACALFSLCFGWMLPLESLAAEGSLAPRIWHLENGLTVLVREDNRFPLASVRLYVRAGSAWESPKESGISHFLEHMVFRGSKTRESGVDSMVENAGGYLNAATSFDNTVYLTDLSSDQWKTAVEAVRDLAFDPLLRQDDFDAERKVVLAERKQRGDSPFTQLYQAMFARALKGTPYERPIIGVPETLEAASPASMREYINEHYDPRDMLLVVAGRVKAEEVLAEAIRLFGAYPNRNIPALPDVLSPEELTFGLQVEQKEGPWNKAYLTVAFPLPAIGHPRNPAADVLAHLLGADESSLLPRRLRLEKNVADEVAASAMNLERAGLFFVMGLMDGDKTELFLNDLCLLLKDLQADDFSDEEIARAKLNLEDSFWRGQETVGHIADVAGNNYYFDPSDPSGLHYLTATRDVSREQIQAVLDDWIRPSAMTVTALLPSGTTVDLAAAVTRAWPEEDAGSPQRAGADLRDNVSGRPELLDLGQGRQLVLWPDKSLPYVSAIMSFSGGDLFTPEDKQGLGALTASMLTSATTDKDYASMNRYLSDRASSVGAEARLTDFSLTLDVPSRFSADIFALFRDVLTKPALSEEDFARSKRDQLNAIVSAEESVMGVMQRNLQPFLFRGTVYGHQINGNAENLARITRQDVREFWDRQRCQPWVLTLVGDFDRDQALAFAQSLPLPQTDKLAPPPAIWREGKSLTLTLPGREQAAYALIFPSVAIADEDSAAMGLLSASLGGFGGLLHQELREKRSLGYSVSPHNWAGEKAGFLAFLIIADPENLEEAERNFIAITNKLHQDLLPEESLERAKAMLEANYYRAQQSRASRAENATRHVAYGRAVDFSRKRLDEMKALTPEDLRDVARKYLVPEKAYSFRVEPVEQ